MSLQHALSYISLSRKAVAPVSDDSISAIEEACAAGREIGLTFTGTELRQAHELDWSMRCQRFGVAFPESG